ncbi:unnamed protein product [Effrenium voratum]|uniref:ZZ-type domain-containing protein n=1 Tax=Effrenium voratum TaxID=2562239 RepID=A0AA36HNN0_9DINO|nr:unnamed protein product [Effrenium voratum]CAJ1448214.1 unnamed protein product [Effrenium voratum]
MVKSKSSGPKSSSGTKKKQVKDDGTDEAAGHLGDLLGEGAGEDKFSVSTKYAKKFNEQKGKIESARAARILADEDAVSSSEESSEDEQAELLTGQVASKIFQTLSKIKAKDPSIYDGSATFFDDKDFQEESTAKPKKDKKMTYSNFLRETLLEEGADAIAREEDAMALKKTRKTPAEEQRHLQDEIRSAAQSVEEGDDLFSLKEQSPEEKEKLDQEFAQFQHKSQHRGDNAEEVMANYWRADEDLDENERFLRDYLMNRQWLETDSLQTGAKKEVFDEESSAEDADHLEEADEFEKDYNFRFEVEEGSQIQGHARFPENSVRERSDKRKRQRKEKAERKATDKVRRAEELKRLKNLKKQEIIRRLEQIREVTGNEDTGLEAGMLDAEFDPREHDETMEQILGSDYDERQEALSSKELVDGTALGELDVSTAAVESLQKNWGIGHQQEDEAPDEEWEGNKVEEAKDEEEEEEEDPELWFLCDGCQKPIPGGKRRFDCAVCENFTLCMKCFRVRRHPHKFVRRKVPERCQPPEDFKGKQLETGDAGTDKSIDEYFQLDYEDIIGGDLPTRFKYRKVEPNDFGIPANVILAKSGSELNRMVSLKKLRPYRDEGEAEGGKTGKGKGKDGKGRGKGGGGTQEGKNRRPQRSAAGSSTDTVSSTRFKAYNLEGDKFAGKKPRFHHKKNKKGKSKD